MAVPDSLIRVANALGDSSKNIDLHEMEVMETLSAGRNLPAGTYAYRLSAFIDRISASPHGGAQL